jgi:hypothetical protein
MARAPEFELLFLPVNWGQNLTPGVNPFWLALRSLCNLQLCRLFFTMVGNMLNMWDSKPLN